MSATPPISYIIYTTKNCLFILLKSTTNSALHGILLLHKIKYPLASGGQCPQTPASERVNSCSQQILDSPLRFKLSITSNTEQFIKVLNGTYMSLGYSRFPWDNEYKETWDGVNGEMVVFTKLDDITDRYAIIIFGYFFIGIRINAMHIHTYMGNRHDNI